MRFDYCFALVPRPAFYPFISPLAVCLSVVGRFVFSFLSLWLRLYPPSSYYRSARLVSLSSAPNLRRHSKTLCLYSHLLSRLADQPFSQYTCNGDIQIHARLCSSCSSLGVSTAYASIYLPLAFCPFPLLFNEEERRSRHRETQREKETTSVFPFKPPHIAHVSLPSFSCPKEMTGSREL